MDIRAAKRVLIELSEGAGPAAETPAAGEPEIPGYRIEKLLGEGAGGRVWLARWSRSDRPVALKVLHRRLDGSASARRAWRELDLLSQVRLPCVPRLLDWSTHEGRMYFATEFVDGERIDRACDTRGLHRRQRVGLLAKLASAVADLHERGVIHRDLKPSNVLVTSVGDPVIIDLGIAAMLGSNAVETLTALGAPIGTPAFMSPEQARGERGAVGTRSDVYALGAIGYMLLTGETPHDLRDATLFEAVRRVGHDEPRDPMSLNRDLERPLSAVLRKASAAEPGSRYSSAAELAEDLERWLRGEPVEAGERSRWTRAVRWIGSHPVAATATLCTCMVLLTALSTVLVLQWLATQPHTLRVADDGSSAWIESRGGFQLRTWTADGTSTRVRAFRASRGDGDDWYAVVSYFDRGAGHAVVDVCDPKDSNRLVGGVRPGREVAPPAYPDCDQTPYPPTPLILIGSAVTVGDVFAERPGEEIVLAERHGSLHPTRLSVLSLSGETFASVWVPGHVQSVLVLDDAGLIAVTSVNNFLTRSIAGGCERAKAYEHPYIVFAYRFAAGVQSERWVTHMAEGSSTNVEWCSLLDEPAKTGQDRRDGVPAFRLVARAIERRSGPDTLLVDTDDREQPRSGLPKVLFRINAESGATFGDPIVEDRAYRVPAYAAWLEMLSMIPAPAFDPNF